MMIGFARTTANTGTGCHHLFAISPGMGCSGAGPVGFFPPFGCSRSEMHDCYRFQPDRPWPPFPGANKRSTRLETADCPLAELCATKRLCAGPPQQHMWEGDMQLPLICRSGPSFGPAEIADWRTGAVLSMFDAQNAPAPMPASRLMCAVRCDDAIDCTVATACGGLGRAGTPANCNANDRTSFDQQSTLKPMYWVGRVRVCVNIKRFICPPGAAKVKPSVREPAAACLFSG